MNNIWNYKNDFKTGIAYSLGLILNKGKPVLKAIRTQTGINALNLSYFLQEEMRYWEIGDIFHKEVSQLEDDGEIILDEVIFPKENTTRMAAHIVYYSAQKRLLLGQEYLVLLWVKGNKVVVVDFAMIEKDADRLQISVALVENFLKQGKRVKGLRADGWFFKEDFVQSIKNLGINLISKPRRDSKWYLGNKEIQLNRYAETLSKDQFHYYAKEGVYAKSIIVANQKYHYCKIVIKKPKHSSPPSDYIYIVSTDIALTTREIIGGMKQRWKIEVVFRDCSQHLGLKDCQAYKEASKTHVAMVFLTYNYLSSLRAKEGGTIGRMKRKIINQCNVVPTRVIAFNNPQMAA